MTKKQNELKKLALLGIATGVLVSGQPLDANFAENNQLNGNYLAASCNANSNGCQTKGVQRTPYGYKSSCNVSNGSGSSCQAYSTSQSSCHAYTPQHSCQSQNPAQHTCQSYYNSNPESAQPATNAVQPATNAVQPTTNAGQPTTNAGQYNNNNNNQTKQQLGTNNDQALNQKNKVEQSAQKNDKYQASNGCGSHGCSSTGGNGSGNGKYQASNGCGNKCNHGGGNTAQTNGSYYYNPNQVAEADTKVTPPKLNEADLLSKLNAHGKETYETLSPEGKKLALQLSNGDCKGKNECKGLNSCKTDKHTCAGLGGCKSQGSANFQDKNLAVKVAGAKMAEKRNALKK